MPAVVRQNKGRAIVAAWGDDRAAHQKPACPEVAAMNDAIADVTIHIDESIDPEARVSLENRLLALDGVAAASSHNGTSHLLVVKFDPERLQSHDILHAVIATGLHAELIGL